jgi:antirestriction protein
MHERDEDEDDDERPVFMAKISEVDDIGLRGAWMDAAEYIADAEEKISLWFRHPMSRSSAVRHGDHIEPGFIYLGDSESLSFIARMAVGIIKHGPAFTFWVRDMGGSPDALKEFEKAFLGQWKSATEFAQHVLEARGDAEESEHRDGEEAREDPETDAESWARDLQRRGEINVVPNPQGGVWVFRGW